MAFSKHTHGPTVAINECVCLLKAIRARSSHQYSQNHSKKKCRSSVDSFTCVCINFAAVYMYSCLCVCVFVFHVFNFSFFSFLHIVFLHYYRSFVLNYNLIQRKCNTKCTAKLETWADVYHPMHTHQPNKHLLIKCVYFIPFLYLLLVRFLLFLLLQILNSQRVHLFSTSTFYVNMHDIFILIQFNCVLDVRTQRWYLCGRNLHRLTCRSDCITIASQRHGQESEQ